MAYAPARALRLPTTPSIGARISVYSSEQASADIAARAAELARAKSDVDRYRTLSDNRFASPQRFEQADANYEKARAADRKARAALVRGRLPVDCSVLCAFRDDGSSHAEVRIKGGEPRRSSQ